MLSEKVVSVRSSARLARPGRSFYIVGAAYDWTFFILAPLWALGLGLAFGRSPLAAPRFPLFGRSESFLSLFSGVFTMSHLSLVFFRSHLNRRIFAAHRARFVVVPALLLGAMILSSWTLVAMFVLSVWWDVYHSSLQTFGLGRMYDARRNADRDAGRSLDRALNLLLYAGPVAAGASLGAHVVHFRQFNAVGTPAFAALADAVMARRPLWTGLVAAAAVPFLLYYVWAYRRLARRGYAVSPQKAALFASTAACSVWAWGFNPFGQAFFIMNFFHSLQYFALVAHAERKNLAERSGLSRFRWGGAAAAVAMVFAALAYGVWAQFKGQSSHLAFSVLIAVSLLHFWYDGFIWSVRRQEA